MEQMIRPTLALNSAIYNAAHLSIFSDDPLHPIPLPEGCPGKARHNEGGLSSAGLDFDHWDQIRLPMARHFRRAGIWFHARRNPPGRADLSAVDSGGRVCPETAARPIGEGC